MTSALAGNIRSLTFPPLLIVSLHEVKYVSIPAPCGSQHYSKHLTMEVTFANRCCSRVIRMGEDKSTF